MYIVYAYLSTLFMKQRVLCLYVYIFSTFMDINLYVYKQIFKDFIQFSKKIRILTDVNIIIYKAQYYVIYLIIKYEFLQINHFNKPGSDDQ